MGTKQLTPAYGEETSMQRRVVVTGMGALCAIGNTPDEIWANAAAGKSGIGSITRFDPAGFETTIAGEIKGFDAAEVVGRKEARRMDRFAQLAVAAALQAREQAFLADSDVDPTRVGALI